MSVVQSERQDVYREYIEELYDNGVVFLEKDSGMVLFDINKFMKEYSDVIEIDDLLKGKVALRLEENLKRGMKFFPVLRSDKSSLYHLSSVIDDSDFGVTHVVRGIDKLSIAEYQEMIRIVLGLEPKKYLHTPMLFDKEGKIPKSGVKFDDFLRMGITPQALISYLVSSGYGDPDTIYPSIDEFIKKFDYHKIHKNNGKFDLEKLKSINEKVIKKISPEIYINSFILYLNKIGDEKTAETLKADSNLSELIISMRRNPEESLNILKCILNPDYKMDTELNNQALDYIFKNSENVFSKSEFDYSTLGFDKKIFYDSLRWVTVGKSSFPNIDKVIEYLKTKNLLQNRISRAMSAFGGMITENNRKF